MDAERQAAESSESESGWRILFKISLFLVVPTVAFGLLSLLLAP